MQHTIIFEPLVGRNIAILKNSNYKSSPSNNFLFKIQSNEFYYSRHYVSNLHVVSLSIYILLSIALITSLNFMLNSSFSLVSYIVFIVALSSSLLIWYLSSLSGYNNELSCHYVYSDRVIINNGNEITEIKTDAFSRFKKIININYLSSTKLNNLLYLKDEYKQLKATPINKPITRSKEFKCDLAFDNKQTKSELKYKMKYIVHNGPDGYTYNQEHKLLLLENLTTDLDEFLVDVQKTFNKVMKNNDIDVHIEEIAY